MKIFKIILLTTILLIFSVSCSVISRQIREESLSSVPFRTLVQSGDQYIGKTVILGGHILETENKAGETIIKVIQTPLSFWDEPTSKDKTEGRFIVLHKGFLDPEVYSKDRQITVAGTIVGRQTEEIGLCPYACLKIESREIHIWPEYEYRDYFPYDDPFYSPYHYYYPYRRYPYYRYPPPYYPYWW